jgi:ankyrin repeat protein
MRLLTRNENGEFVFTRIFHDPPPYAILSHTWSKEPNAEVLYQDIVDGTAKSKPSFAKIVFIAEQARKENIEYFWVDSCCINKGDYDEVSTAIPEMYRWYERSALCFVYLTDVSIHKRDHGGEPKWDESFRACEWFKRGWTLQELLAPNRVEFFAHDFHLGNRTKLSEQIHEITGVHIEALRGNSPKDLSIPTRMRWAAGRMTTVEEDRAYSLMGLCDVTMPPRYSEGFDNAQRRLLEEIRSTFGAAALGSAPEPESERLDYRQTIGMVPSALSEARKAKLEKLDFDDIDFRRTNIRMALKSTCTWILKHEAYVQWRDAEASKKDFGFFWIKGKPGAGKSVLVRYLELHISRSIGRRDICISHYFYARGGQLEKSLEGMYRSLLVQLLRSHEDLQVVLDNFRPGGTSRNTLQKLRVLISAAVAMLEDRQLFCFIDALDECDTENMQDTIRFFRDLCEEAAGMGIQIFICFASRHYPEVVIPTGLQIKLESVEEHHADLARYVKSQRFSYGAQGMALGFPDEVQNEIRTKANGVFLWVYLVCGILTTEFTKGKIRAVKDRLKELPQDLAELFQQLVQRDQENVDKLLLCLTWILHAERRLTLKELYFALIQDYEYHEWESEDSMRRFLRSSSKGLAELTRGANPHVQFIHESVRDFLLGGDGFRYIDPNHNASVYQANETLKQCCLRGIEPASSTCWLTMKMEGRAFNFDNHTHDWRPSKRQAERGRLQDRFPFMEYAIQYIFIHADQAAPEFPQGNFIDRFDFKDWRAKANWMKKCDINVYTPDTTLAYVFAHMNCANLIITLAQHSIKLNAPTDNRNRYPLLAAFANKRKDTARVLLEQDGADAPDDIIKDVIVDNYRGKQAYDVDPRISLFAWAAEQGFETYAAHLSRKLDKSEQELILRLSWSNAMSRKHATVCERLLRYSSVANLRLPEVTLQKMTEHALTGCVQVLLNHGDGVHAMNDAFWAALIEATTRGHDDIVQLLLDKADELTAMGKFSWPTSLEEGKKHIIIEIHKKVLERSAAKFPERNRYDIALHNAVSGGNIEFARLLFEWGANANAQRSNGETVLQNASYEGRHDMVELLLDRGAHIDAQSESSSTALYIASDNNDLALVRLLLDRGADVNVQNDVNGTALNIAALQGNVGIVKLLLERGADVNARGGYYGTALQDAAFVGSEDVVRLLVQKGADVDAQDSANQSALEIALSRGYRNVVAALESVGAQED